MYVNHRASRTKKTSVACMETHNNAQALKLLKRKMSDPDIHHLTTDINLSLNGMRSAAITIPCRTDDTHNVANSNYFIYSIINDNDYK